MARGTLCQMARWKLTAIYGNGYLWPNGKVETHGHTGTGTRGQMARWKLIVKWQSGTHGHMAAGTRSQMARWNSRPYGNGNSWPNGKVKTQCHIAMETCGKMARGTRGHMARHAYLVSCPVPGSVEVRWALKMTELNFISR